MITNGELVVGGLWAADFNKCLLMPPQEYYLAKFEIEPNTYHWQATHRKLAKALKYSPSKQDH